MGGWFSWCLKSEARKIQVLLSLVIDEKARQIRKTFGGLSGSPESEQGVRNLAALQVF